MIFQRLTQMYYFDFQHKNIVNERVAGFCTRLSNQFRVSKHLLKNVSATFYVKNSILSLKVPVAFISYTVLGKYTTIILLNFLYWFTRELVKILQFVKAGKCSFRQLSGTASNVTSLVLNPDCIVIYKQCLVLVAGNN